jgi:hypothetical protein
VDAKDYRRLPVAPTAGKAGGALAFVALGFATSWAVSRVGSRD